MLYDLQARLDEKHVYYKAEVEEFCKVFFKPKAKQTPGDQGKINAILDPAVARFKALDEAAQEEFKGWLVSLRNLCALLSQVVPYQDADLEKLYTFIRFFLSKLPPRSGGPRYVFDDEVSLRYYRLQKISEGAIILEPGVGGMVYGPTEVGTRLDHRARRGSRGRLSPRRGTGLE